MCWKSDPASTVRQARAVRPLIRITRAEVVEPRFDGRPTDVLFTVDGFTVEAGQIVAVLGESGSGKTTFLRSLLDSAYAVRGNEVILPSSDAVRLLSQDYRATFSPALSILRHLRDVIPAKRPDAVGRAVRAACAFGLRTRHVRALPTELSGGELQRAALARLMLSSAEVVLLDEPTASQDAAHRRVIAALLVEHARGTGKGVVIATHDRQFAYAVAHAVWGIDRGALVRVERTDRSEVRR